MKRYASTRIVMGLLVLGTALLASPTLAADAAPKKGVTIEGITEYQLDNGLRVLLFPDQSTANVTVNLTVFVGSRHEGYGETGMAHLLEHMVFKGTPKHPDVPKALKEHGAQFNGTTWVDRTNYFETMPATDDNLEFGIRLEADRMVNSFVRREDLLKEMTVVRNEFEMGENSPDRILSQRMTAAAYEWHNYGKSTIGNRSDIERVPIDRLQAFYRKFYQPDNAMLVVAGKFDEKKALEYVAKHFGSIKKPERQLDMTYTEEPAQDGERTVVLRRVGKIGVVGVIYHISAGAHEDFAAVEVLNSILTSEPAGRVYKALVESKKATSIDGSAYGFHDPGLLEISVQVDKNAKLEDIRDTLIDLLEKMPTQTLSDEEVERARRQLLSQRERLMTNSNRIGVVLSEWAAKGDWRLFFLHRDRLEKVTAKDVQRVASTYLKRSNRTVGMFVPQEKAEYANVPETPTVADLVKDYKGRANLTAGEAFEPTPENIEKRVQRTQLPIGLKLALLPKKTRGESVKLQLSLHYGSEQSLNGHQSATQFLGPLMARGTKKHTRQQLQDELDKLGARLSPSGLIGDLSFTIECKKANLPAVLQILGEILREPTFPADEFDVLKREAMDRLEKGLPEPTARAFREIQRQLSPYPADNVRYTPTIEESIARLKAVSVEEVRKIWQEQVGGQVGELAVVGDFEPEQVVKLVGEIVGDWKAKTPFERIARPANTDVKGDRITINTPDKKNAVYVSGHMIAMTDTDPDFAALEVGNFLFGGGTLSSRLGNRVRQKEGLSYGVRSQFAADSRDKSARFVMFAICNPENMPKVDKVIAEELDKILKEGVAKEELAEAKKSYLEQQKTSRANDSTLAGILASDLFDSRKFDYYADLEKKVAGLTVEDVNQAVRKHWTGKKLVVIHAGDLKK